MPHFTRHGTCVFYTARHLRILHGTALAYFTRHGTGQTGAVPILLCVRGTVSGKPFEREELDMFATTDTGALSVLYPSPARLICSSTSCCAGTRHLCQTVLQFCTRQSYPPRPCSLSRVVSPIVLHSQQPFAPTPCNLPPCRLSWHSDSHRCAIAACPSTSALSAFCA